VRLESLRLIVCGLVLTSTAAVAQTPAEKAYADVSPLRDKHSDVIWEGKPADESELRQILADLDKGLARLDEPLNRDLADGNRYLRYRRYNFLIDKAKVLLRLKDQPGALAALHEMAQMDWNDPAGIDERKADLRALIASPAAADLRAIYARGQIRGFKSEYREELPANERLAGLSLIWSTARDGFAWFDHVPDLDWNQAYLDAIPRVLAAADTAAYYRELMRFTALLQDGHSNAYPPKELTAQFYSRPGLVTQHVDGRVLVTRIRDASLLTQGLQVGDQLLSIDGHAVDAYMAEYLAPFLSSSTPQDREVRGYSYGLLAGPADQPVRLKLQHANGQDYEISAPRKGYTATPGPASERFELRPDGVAVLKAGQFENGAAAKLLNAHESELATAKALILDLRDNGGGSSSNGYALLSRLTDQPLQVSEQRIRGDNPYRRTDRSVIQWQQLGTSTVSPSNGPHFKAPVALLINAATFSAAEDTAAAFKWMKRGLIIGSASGGSTGQPLLLDLPGGGTARICVKRDSYPDGSDFVGVGVLPDIEVKPTVASVRDGSDPVLARAVKELLASH